MKARGLDEFLTQFRGEMVAAAVQEWEGDAMPSRLRENIFTRQFLDRLEDRQAVPGGEVCYLEKTLRGRQVKINGWYVDELESRLDVFASVFLDAALEVPIAKEEVRKAIVRAVRAVAEARRGSHVRMEPADDALEMMDQIHEKRNEVSRVRVLVFTDGVIAGSVDVEETIEGCEVRHEVWDIQRLFRLCSSDLPYEPLEIDFVARFGRPLLCLPMPPGNADYGACLAIVPGLVLRDIYHEFGARLLELNVRSFLQARGKVNKGIRQTLLESPSRFLAYNNGISVTAERVEYVQAADGCKAIRSISGLQIVNGGQTVASIHRAGTTEGLDLSDVFVQAKITTVRPEQVETLVPLISRYANTQNKVNDADFFANSDFHIALERLSRSVWVPGEQSRWFYERARGQYQVARFREGTTPAKLRSFDRANPAAQRMDKVLVAKYLNAGDERPHEVSLGNQKNFVRFMERIHVEHEKDWQPDREWYCRMVARAILYKKTEVLARRLEVAAYRANTVAYTVSLLAWKTVQKIDLDRIWAQQEVSSAIQAAVMDWMPLVHDRIRTSAGSANVTEWCKKVQCWAAIQTLDVEVSSQLAGELTSREMLPTVGEEKVRSGESLTPQDRENISRVMTIVAEDWLAVHGWGIRTGELHKWQSGIAHTLAGYAAAGWLHVPSPKQARHALEALEKARGAGALSSRQS